jgi:hypothetical protein
MFTLLPQQQKKSLFRQYRTRLSIVFLVFIASFFLVSTILLLPSYVYLSFSKSTLDEQVVSLEKKIKDKSNKGIMTILGGIQSNLALIKPDETEVASVIKKVTDDMNSDISISSFSYTFSANNNSSLTFKGVAKTRSALIDFSKELKKELLFSGVDLPISNLAKENDISFNITVLGRF